MLSVDGLAAAERWAGSWEPNLSWRVTQLWGQQVRDEPCGETGRMKVEFVGTFAAVNLKSAEWLTSHPEVRLIQEVGPFRPDGLGPNSYDEPDWTVTIEYEERVSDTGSRAA
jgi:hypothetical protein